ncbi:MAG TPA: hypothetical protein VIM12_04850 [Noviherbaspirillum sp.]|jgi:hypothetical protein|uniref:hypothetical protein n=1 Tax=Noviherbaspirillum sp. TaxID=1926288 RepID=UPI002F952093
MDATRWKAEFLHREGDELMPKQLPVEVLIRLARSMAMYKDGALDRFEMEGVWDLLKYWIEKLLDAQDPSRLQRFQKKTDELLPTLADELDLWIRMELVSRQIGYPIYTIAITGLFATQFAAKGAK